MLSCAQVGSQAGAPSAIVQRAAAAKDLSQSAAPDVAPALRLTSLKSLLTPTDLCDTAEMDAKSLHLHQEAQSLPTCVSVAGSISVCETPPSASHAALVWCLTWAVNGMLSSLWFHRQGACMALCACTPTLLSGQHPMLERLQQRTAFLLAADVFGDYAHGHATAPVRDKAATFWQALAKLHPLPKSAVQHLCAWAASDSWHRRHAAASALSGVALHSGTKRFVVSASSSLIRDPVDEVRTGALGMMAAGCEGAWTPDILSAVLHALCRSDDISPLPAAALSLLLERGQECSRWPPTLQHSAVECCCVLLLHTDVEVRRRSEQLLNSLCKDASNLPASAMKSICTACCRAHVLGLCSGPSGSLLGLVARCAPALPHADTVDLLRLLFEVLTCDHGHVLNSDLIVASVLSSGPQARQSSAQANEDFAIEDDDVDLSGLDIDDELEPRHGDLDMAHAPQSLGEGQVHAELVLEGGEAAQTGGQPAMLDLERRLQQQPHCSVPASCTTCFASACLIAVCALSSPSACSEVASLLAAKAKEALVSSCFSVSMGCFAVCGAMRAVQDPSDMALHLPDATFLAVHKALAESMRASTAPQIEQEEDLAALWSPPMLPSCMRSFTGTANFEERLSACCSACEPLLQAASPELFGELQQLLDNARAVASQYLAAAEAASPGARRSILRQSRKQLPDEAEYQAVPSTVESFALHELAAVASASVAIAGDEIDSDSDSDTSQTLQTQALDLVLERQTLCSHLRGTIDDLEARQLQFRHMWEAWQTVAVGKPAFVDNGSNLTDRGWMQLLQHTGLVSSAEPETAQMWAALEQARDSAEVLTAGYALRLASLCSSGEPLVFRTVQSLRCSFDGSSTALRTCMLLLAQADIGPAATIQALQVVLSAGPVPFTLLLALESWGPVGSLPLKTSQIGLAALFQAAEKQLHRDATHSGSLAASLALLPHAQSSTSTGPSWLRCAARQFLCAVLPLLHSTVGTPPAELQQFKTAIDAGAEFAASLLAGVRKVANISDVLPPDSQPSAALRVYQLDGVLWLHYLWKHGMGGILADDMGLGKTLQVLTALAVLAVEGFHSTAAEQEVLVVAPGSVHLQWAQEVSTFFNSATVQGRRLFEVSTIPPGQAAKAAVEQLTAQRAPMSCCMSLTIMSYAQLRAHAAGLAQKVWFACVLDEGHVIQNPASATHKAAMTIQAAHRVMLTGTPVQNRLLDVWAIFNWACPGALGSQADFKRAFSKPVRAARSKNPKTAATAARSSSEALQVLERRVIPFVLRRTKAAVLPELPSKAVQDVLCEMTPKQAKLYNGLAQTPEFSLLAATPRSKPVKGSALKHLIRLQQVVNHPRLVPGASRSRKRPRPVFPMDESGKMMALANLLECLLGKTAEDVAASKRARQPLESTSPPPPAQREDAYGGGHASHMKQAAKDAEKYGVGDTPALQRAARLLARDRASDPQLPRFLQRAALQGADGEDSERDTQQHPCKILIFAQHRGTLEAVEKGVLQAGFPAVPYAVLHGGLSSEQRGTLAAAFNDTANPIKVLLSTTGVGGLGLNLTAASTVIFVDHSWNPQVDLQAQDRAHRMGQSMPVHVFRLIMKDSLEQTVMAAQSFKLGVAAAVVGSDRKPREAAGSGAAAVSAAGL